MKKIYLGAVFTLMSIFASAQDYDHWSIDIGGGMHQAGSTLSPGFSENIFGQGHIGYRYMFNEKFGLRLDLGYNSFTANEDSQPFTSNYYRASLEGVVNLGSVLKFRTWTNRFNLLAHGGVGAASLNITDPVDNGGDVMFAMNFGITPQFKLNNRFSLFLDFSSIIHFYQEDNFDGGPNSATRESNISLFNTSIGLNIALGKNKQSADFWRGEEAIVVNSELESIKNRLDTAEKEIQVLKTKESSPNKELIMTELDNRYVKKGETTYGDVVTSSNVDFIKELLNRGYVNVFFDINSTKIQKESLSSVNYLRQFLYDNPYVNASLIGFTDETGNEDHNQSLSNNRAKAVFDMLVASGISPTRLSYGGVGEDKTMSKGARQLARKVTFKIN
ncbi:OmpA family protein [Polaribacter vadi]|uniref:OmpA family protein n=1 Tax=Polaribacter vadi TaxID=1774273 RepID=UPI0030EC105C|tara:strand:+ start:84507 stop:85673 length:1167 start_codon:yes stop_codon:yes gene_type:complete